MSSAERLLQAAFLEGDFAFAAWDEWREEVDHEAVDPECYVLLPLLHRKLEGLGVEPAELLTLGAVRRRIEVQNQMVLDEAWAALQDLAEAGIDTLLLGELALVSGYYRDPGLRPIRQIEILVPRGEASRAAGVLALGSFRVALRRNALHLGCPRRIEQAWWEGAIPTLVLEAESRVLAPADQLVYTLVSGQEQNHPQTGFWMADALVVLSESPVDPDRVVELAAALRVTLFVRRALEQLDMALGRPIAPDLGDLLSSSPVSRSDRLEYEYITRRRGQRSMLSWLVASPRRFLRSHS